MKVGDKVQVFDAKKFEYLGWNEVINTCGCTATKDCPLAQIRLKNGKCIFSDDPTYIILSEAKAIEVADRIMKEAGLLEDLRIQNIIGFKKKKNK